MRFTIKTLFIITLLIGGCCWFFLPFSPKIEFHGDDGVLSSLRYPDPSSSRVKVKFTNNGISSIYYPGAPSAEHLVSSFDLVHDGKAIVQMNPHWLKVDSYNRYVKKARLAPGESAFVDFNLTSDYFGFCIQFEVTDWRGRKAMVKSKYIHDDQVSPNL
jgi:hypothetical protein